MAVIVYNKNTGKYLKRHSGSYRDFLRKKRYKVAASLGVRACYYGDLTPEEQAQCDKVTAAAEELAFCADPVEARVYANESSARGSVGYYREIPPHLELHEIKEAFVCIMRPDGSSNCDEDKDGRKEE